MENSKKKKPLKKEITVTLGGNKIILTFPTNGELLIIESNKQSFSYGEYNAIAGTITGSAKAAQLLIDSIATFQVVIKDFDKILNVDNLFGLTLFETEEVINEYINVYNPWFQGWLLEFNKSIKIKADTYKELQDVEE